MHSVAKLLVEQGKLGEAEPLYVEALRARRETLGDTHPDTLSKAHGHSFEVNPRGVCPVCTGRCSGSSEREKAVEVAKMGAEHAELADVLELQLEPRGERALRLLHLPRSRPGGQHIPKGERVQPRLLRKQRAGNV